MDTRQLLISALANGKTRGNCDSCDFQFESGAPDAATAAREIRAVFIGHTCQKPKKKATREDVNQVAARIVREATDK